MLPRFSLSLCLSFVFYFRHTMVYELTTVYKGECSASKGVCGGRALDPLFTYFASDTVGNTWFLGVAGSNFGVWLLLCHFPRKKISLYILS
ncbi:hypothetical protein B0T17DRAFT_539642 [Bombardia bombarda]|uniref:Secreted protein n=1 Tax=Bombardia bombarda TaxID=252184 RepID=A0AA40BW53_9PEZI|nr:hypothetical protein B0T17DRAFT_539642 [Bombardia bombarda]